MNGPRFYIERYGFSIKATFPRRGGVGVGNQRFFELAGLIPRLLQVVTGRVMMSIL
jgi:hypothetical protein